MTFHLHNNAKWIGMHQQQQAVICYNYNSKIKRDGLIFVHISNDLYYFFSESLSSLLLIFS